MFSIKNLEKFIQEITLPNEEITDEFKNNQINLLNFSDSEYNMKPFVSFLELNFSTMNNDNYNNDEEFFKNLEMKLPDSSDFLNFHKENKILKNSNKRVVNTPTFRNTINMTNLKIKGDSQANLVYDENVSLSSDLHFGGIKKINPSENSENNTNFRISILKKSDIVTTGSNSKFKNSHLKTYKKKSVIKPYTPIEEKHLTEEKKQIFKAKTLSKKNSIHQAKINDEKENMKNNFEENELPDIIIESVVENKSLIQDTENTSTVVAINNSCENPIIIDSDSSNDDLLILPSGLIETSVDDGSNKLMLEVDIANHTISGNLSKCTLSLDSIIDAKNETLKKDQLIYNASKEEIDDNKFEDTDLKLLIKNVIIKEIQKDRITDLPLGLKIFDHKKCYRYFCMSHGLNLESCGFNANDGNTFDKKVAKLSTAEIKELIKFGVFQCQLNSMKCKEAFLEYCFKLLSVLNNSLLSFACTDILWYYIRTSKNGNICWYPSMKDILTIILNYGVNVVDHCPIKNTFIKCEKLLMKFENNCLLEKEDATSCWNKESFLVEDGLCEVLNILISFLQYKCNYSQEELCDLILLLSWISLDTKLIGKQIKIKESIQICLARITALDWPDKMKYLTEELAQVGNHHRNTLYVIQLLPLSNRGISLQKAISFLAIQHLLNLENPYFVADVTPSIVLEMFRDHLQYVQDYFILHSVISLMDLCIGNYVLPQYREALQEMCKIIMDTFGKIRDTFQCLEGPKVKSLIARLNNKWNTIIHSLPNNEVTIFKYLNTYNQDPQEFDNGMPVVNEINPGDDNTFIPATNEIKDILDGEFS